MTDPRSPEIGSWRVLADVAERSQRYLNDIGERRVAPSRDALAGLGAFDVPLQEGSISAEQIVEELDRIGSPATMAIAGPRFFGFVNSSALPARGTSGFRTSGSTSPRATVTSCSRSIWSPASTVPPRSRRSTASGTGSRPHCRSARSAASPPTTSG